MYKHVLFASDLMAESQDAAHKAKAVASALGAKLSLVHVVENVPTAYGSPVVLDVEVTLHDEAVAELKKLADELGVGCGVVFADAEHPDPVIFKAGPAVSEIARLLSASGRVVFWIKI